MPQQAFGRERRQRLAQGPDDLAAQHVEQLRRSGGQAHLDVVFGAKLQIALQPRRRVFRALPFVAMRQQHRQTAKPRPLGLAARDELIDHHLGAVGEIAELRFPDHQRLGRGGGVAVLEGQHRFLGQQRIVDVERGPRRQVVQRDVTLAVLLVVNRGMPVREGADAHVLPRQAHRMALIEQAGVSHHFGEAPVDGRRAGGHALAVVKNPLHLAVQDEALRHAVHLRGEFLQALAAEARIRRRRPLLAEMGPPIHEQFDARLMHQALRHMVAGIEGLAVALRLGIGLRLRNGAFRHQPFGVEGPGGGVRVNRLVHERLRFHRFFGFVVPAPPVAHQVDHHVFLELHPVIRRDLRCEQRRLRIVRVHMEDRRPHQLRHFRAIFGGARVIHPMRGEADLVVHDDVQGAAGVEPAGLRHLERLHHHALAGKGRIAMHHHRRHEIAGVVAPPVLPGAHRALHHRRNDLQMRRVERQRHMHFAAGRFHVRGKPLVVFHVPHAGFHHAPFKLVEEIARVLAQDVHQHVQTAPVRHADHRLHHAVGAEALQRLVQHGDEALAALQAKALGAGILGLQVLLQPLGGGEPFEQHALGIPAERRRRLSALQALPQP